VPGPSTDGRFEGVRQWGELAVQVLAAGVGIGAWVAVVGGARLWARLEAADIPAAQTIPLLPRELLIAEGTRTLLVPLLVGGAVAVLVYLSRKSEMESPARSVAATTPAELGERRRTTAKAAIGAATLALNKSQAAQNAIDDLRYTLNAAGRRAARDKSPLGNLGPAIHDAHRALAAAVASFEQAAMRAAMAHGVTTQALGPRPGADRTPSEGQPPGGPRRVFRLPRRDQAINDAQSAWDVLEDARQILLDVREAVEDVLGTLDHEPLEHVDRIEQVQRLLGARDEMSRIEAMTKEGLGRLKAAGRATPTEGWKRFLERVDTLAPVQYLRPRLESLSQDHGGLWLVGFLVLIAIGGVAFLLVFLDVDRWAVVGTVSVVALCGLALMWPGDEPSLRRGRVVIGVGVLVSAAVAAVTAVTLAILDVGWWAAGSIAAGLALLGVAILWGQRQLLLGIAVLLAAIPAAGIAGVLTALEGRYAFYAALVTVVTVWLALGAMARWSRPAAVAWIVFAAIAFWSGALSFLQERGTDDPTLEVAVVKRKSSPATVYGFYLGRTSERIYLASAAACPSDGCRRVLSIDEEDAACVALGPRQKVNDPKPVDSELLEFVNGRPVTAKGEHCVGTGQKPGDTGSQGVFAWLQLHVAYVVRLGAWIIDLPPWKPPPQPPPQPPPAPQTRTRLVVASDVLFRFRSSKLTRAGQARVSQVVGWIRRWRPAHVYVHGHTDNIDAKGNNRRLSRARARRVRRAVLAALPTDRPKIHPRGFGETRPLDCNKKSDGSDDRVARAYNRRVEIYTRKPTAYKKPDCRGRPQ